MTPEQIILLVFGVLLGIPAFILLILALAKAKLCIRLQNGLCITLRIFGYRIPLWDEEKRKSKRKKLKRCRHPRHVLRKEMRNAKRAILKKHLKNEKKKQKKVQKKQKKKKLPKMNLQEQLELLLRFVAICYRRTYGRLRIRVHKFHIRVGTPDAARTAIAYGAIAQTVAYTLELIDARYAMILYDAKAVSVTPDFLSGKPSAEVDLECSLSLLRILLIYRSVTEDYNNAKYKVYKKAIQRRKDELMTKKILETNIDTHR